MSERAMSAHAEGAHRDARVACLELGSVLHEHVIFVAVVAEDIPQVVVEIGMQVESEAGCDAVD